VEVRGEGRKRGNRVGKHKPPKNNYFGALDSVDVFMLY
jgi:hypothetical protein